tara:strand:- start:337 stop:621 length:285 start_codon:yes stop_codon:yes gene_type:complete
LIEFFAEILGEDHADLRLWYENNSPDNRGDDIILAHPLDRLYLPEQTRCREPSAAILKYEAFAKRSLILKKFEENSPANIEYFQKGPCSQGEEE